MEWGPNKGVVSLRSQIHSFAVCVAATYSASAVDRVIISCFLEAQEMAPPLMRNAKLDIAWRCSCNAPSASV